MMIIMLSLRIKVDDWKLVPIQDGIFAIFASINIIVVTKEAAMKHSHHFDRQMEIIIMNIE